MVYAPRRGRNPEDNNVTVGMLYRELVSERGASTESADELLSETAATLFDEPVGLSDDVVKGNLDAVLLALVANGAGDTHGKGLMETLAEAFDADFSPGTVYPLLHDLEADGCLETRELVRTKEYAVDDTDASKTRVRAAARQHLLLGAFLDQVAADL
jgi:hypothetical protein